MKKILLILIFCSTFLSASFLDYHIDHAKALYDQNRYKEAVQYLDEYTQEFPDYIELNFLLGQIYYQLQQYEMSIIYFERILILDENHIVARLELAQSYMMANLDSDAILHFNFVLKSNVPNNVKSNIHYNLDYIQNKGQKHFFNGFVAIGFTQDSNINNTTDISSFDTINYSNIQITDQQYSDNYSSLIISANHKYKINDTSLLQNKLLYLREDFKKDNQRKSNFNSTGIEKEKKKELELYLYNFEYLKNFDNKNISFSLDLANVKLAKNDYLNIKGVSSSYSQTYFKNAQSKISVKFFEKAHNQEVDKNLDSYNYQISFQTQLKTLSYGTGTFSYSILNEKLKKQTINTSDKLSNSIILSNAYNITKDLQLQSTFNYSQADYKSKDNNFNIKRLDKLSTIKVGLSYNIKPTLNISSSISYKENDSNIDIYSYDKNIINLLITQTF